MSGFSETDLTMVERDLVDAFRAGEMRALARAISWVENSRPGFERLLATVHGGVGRAHRLGITGPPGAGKSSLIRALAPKLRERGERLGIVAVDPTSPFTGGALLGDRIRMLEASGDEGVFIRSMASRGSLGGIATTTREVADLMDAFGFDRVVVETVGVGQSELEIAAAADTTVVVLTPESGDAIQAMKAGLMEIADVFVVNKADRQGADRAVSAIRTTLHLRAGQTLRGVPTHHGTDLTALARRLKSRDDGENGPEEPTDTWSAPVLKTSVEAAEGVDALLSTIDEHVDWLQRSGQLEERRRQRLLERVRAAVERGLRTRVWKEGAGVEILEAAEADLVSGERTPYDVAEEILHSIDAARRDVE